MMKGENQFFRLFDVDHPFGFHILCFVFDLGQFLFGWMHACHQMQINQVADYATHLQGQLVGFR